LNPITHFLTGWVAANTVALEKRDRWLVTAAAVVPDLDGLGVVAERLTKDWEQPLLWWTNYHHVLTHHLGFGLAFAAGQWALNAWPNFAITAALLAATLYFAIKKGFSPLELISAKADRAFVETLRSRLGGQSSGKA
jgi:hypothetical protein